MATIIKATGEKVEVQPANGHHFTLVELQQAVGGYAEVVTLRGGQVMVVNEDGHGLGLPWNQDATALYQHSPIAGDVLLCKASNIR